MRMNRRVCVSEKEGEREGERELNKRTEIEERTKKR